MSAPFMSTMNRYQQQPDQNLFLQHRSQARKQLRLQRHLPHCVGGGCSGKGCWGVGCAIGLRDFCRPVQCVNWVACVLFSIGSIIFLFPSLVCVCTLLVSSSFVVSESIESVLCLFSLSVRPPHNGVVRQRFFLLGVNAIDH